MAELINSKYNIKNTCFQRTIYGNMTQTEKHKVWSLVFRSSKFSAHIKKLNYNIIIVRLAFKHGVMVSGVLRKTI